MAKDFTLDDFRRQLDQVQKMGRTDLLSHMPGLAEMEEQDLDLALQRIRQMIDAMTDEERNNPDLITKSSFSRIAASSGTQPQEVDEFLAQFNGARALMRRIAS